MKRIESAAPNFYVYIHKEPLRGEVVYVGKGSGGRAWDVTRNRNKEEKHLSWMLNLVDAGHIPSDWVVILDRGLTERQALTAEKRYLHENGRTRFNRQCGENNYQAKLTDQQAREIYICTKTTKDFHKDIARKYGISRTCVSMISSGKQWRSTTTDLRKIYEQ